MTTPKLEGVLPAFPTPTTPDGSVDVPALRHLVEQLVRRGANGLVPVGGTGEYTALSPAARLTVVTETVKVARGRVPVVAGVLSPGFGEAIETGEAFRQAGADAILLITPFYARPTQPALRAYFKTYRDRLGLPVLLYDIPSRTGVISEPQTIKAMVDDGSIVGTKACNVDVNHFNHVAALVGDRIALLSGEDTHFPAHLALGAHGGILALAALAPEPWLDIYALAKAGRVADAVAAQRRLLPLIDAVFAETNPGPLKVAMALAGLPCGSALPPLHSPGTPLIARLQAALEELGMIERARVA